MDLKTKMMTKLNAVSAALKPSLVTSLMTTWLALIGASHATSSQKQVVLTFEYVNGTLVPVVHNSTETSSSINTGPLIAAVFLVRILALTFSTRTLIQTTH